MTEAEIIADLREVFDTPFLGVPLVWYVVGVFIACMVGMGWVVVDGHRRHKDPQ